MDTAAEQEVGLENMKAMLLQFLAIEYAIKLEHSERHRRGDANTCFALSFMIYLMRVQDRRRSSGAIANSLERTCDIM